MLWAIIFLITTIISVIINVFLLVYLDRTAQILFSLEDDISEMAEHVFLAKYKIGRVNEMPVAVDSPEVKFVVETVREVEELVAAISHRASEIKDFRDKRQQEDLEE